MVKQGKEAARVAGSRGNGRSGNRRRRSLAAHYRRIPCAAVRIMCLVALALGLSQSVAAQGPFAPEDVNQDSVIDVVDVQLTVNIILALTPPSYAGEGDANGDSLVDVVDVQTVVNKILFPDPSPPQISGTAAATVQAGSLWSYTPTLGGYPSPTLSLATGAPTWVTAGTDSVSGTPSNLHVGANTFTIVASNGVSPDATQQVTVTVTPGPAAPTISGTPPSPAVTGILWVYTPTLTGNPTAAIIGFAPGAPTWLAFNATSVYGNPGLANVGLNTFTIIVSNGIQPNATQVVQLSVISNAVAPQINGNPPATVEVGSLWSYTPLITGTPTPTLSLAQGPPAWISLLAGNLSGTPPSNALGTHTFDLVASNGVQPNAVQTITVTVILPLTPPSISGTPPAAATVGVVWSYLPTLGGNPTPNLSLAVGAPAWVTIQSGYVTGTPTATDVGSNTFTIVASNGVLPDATQFINVGVQPGAASGWTATSTTGAPSARYDHGAAYISAQMVVWGGTTGSTAVGTGAMYLPALDSWTTISTVNAPVARDFSFGGHPVSTGQYFVVWGGGPASAPLNTGAYLDPVTNTWTTMSATGAPSGRTGHALVWMGSRLVVWGGNTSGIVGYTNNGAMWGQTTNSWVAFPTVGAPSARGDGMTALWTGSEIIIWGGGNPNPLGDGAIYNPIGSAWRPTPVTAAPSARQYHTAVWTGTQMLVWGGQVAGGGTTDTGARLDPATLVGWAGMTSVGAPTARARHSAVWTGSRMIVWGGQSTSSTSPHTNTGGSYDPVTDTWSPVTLTGAPGSRTRHTAVWDGTKMIVWGGYSGSPISPTLPITNTGGVLTP